MADLSGLAAFGSAIYPGVVQGQTNQAVSQQQQEAAKQAQMRTQEIASDVASDVSYANSLAALSTVFNTPPGNPPPQGAGQASQPPPPPPPPPPQPPPQAMPPQGAAPGVVPPTPPGQTQPMPATATGQPVAPPGGQFGASAPGGPVAGPPPQAQPQRPPMPPQAAPRPQGAPPGGGPPPQGAQQPNPQQIVALAKQKAAQAEQQTAQATAPAQGQMSMQQLVALVNKANPGLVQKNPSAFVKTVERLQKFLSADGKNELAQQKMSMEYDAKIQKIQSDGQIAIQKAQNAAEVAQIRADNAQAIADIRAQQAQLLQGQRDAAAGDRQDKKDKTTESVQDKKDTAAKEKNTISADDPRVKAIANYQLPPGSTFGSNTPYGTSLMNAVLKVNPSYDATKYGAKNAAVTKFTSGKQGDTIRSFGVATSHLDTLGQLTDALSNGNTQAVNKIGNTVSAWAGGTAPTNFDAARTIVGQEITKAIVASGGGQKEREEAADKLSLAKTPAQLKGVIETYKKLLGGQLEGYRRQYEQATGLKNFDDLLSPETRKTSGATGDAAAPAEAGGDEDTIKSSLEAHGQTYAPDKFDYRIGPNGQVQAKPKAAGGQGASPFDKSPRVLPKQGVLPGELHLNNNLAPTVPKGTPRPFAPGEWVQNANGSWSSEISTTVQMPDGKWSVVPTLWLVNGKPTRVSEDQAVDYAEQSKLPFKRFSSEAEAEKFSQAREDAWQKVQPEQASKIAPLWGAQ